MKQSDIKNKIVAVPFIGYCARTISAVVKAPRNNDEITKKNDDLLHEQGRLATILNETVEDLNRQSEQLKAYFKENNAILSALQLTQDNIKQSLEQRPIENRGSKLESNTEKSGLFADNHDLDIFYAKFEDRFRGSEKLITERLEDYLPLFINSKVDFSKSPVLDIGSGRGEFLQLLKLHKINAVGLDINYDMVKRSKEKGLEVAQGDALEYLESGGSQRFGAVTGFHIVEHIPFDALMKIFSVAHRSLKSNGFVLFETPNPENVTVGSSGFYMDPSHLNPLPPQLLAFALETCGFRKVEIMRLHPSVRPEDLHLHEQIANYFYGALDYAVIGYK
jgi:SAM-dependent methyltransferase